MTACGVLGGYGMVIAVAIAACGGREATHHAAMPPATPIERAHAYERGTGVPRDYRAAAELYRAACDNGRGDVAACGALTSAASGQDKDDRPCFSRKRDPVRWRPGSCAAIACRVATAAAGSGGRSADRAAGTAPRSAR